MSIWKQRRHCLVIPSIKGLSVSPCQLSIGGFIITASHSFTLCDTLDQTPQSSEAKRPHSSCSSSTFTPLPWPFWPLLPLSQALPQSIRTISATMA